MTIITEKLLIALKLFLKSKHAYNSSFCRDLISFASWFAKIAE